MTGALQVDATTRLGGGALTSAVRRVLGPIAERPRVRRVAYYTDGAPLRAPDGVELQILQEVTPVGDDVEIVSINKDRQMFTASLARLFPHPFGPKDLGY